MRISKLTKENGMIEAVNLKKRYGNISAIDNISFRISKGEIIGFLGPNGAGKTTTMKILTCFMRPTVGDVKIDGLDIYDNTNEIKKKIGYLPESNPLYYDMRVMEFLNYMARLKEIPAAKIKNELKEAIEKCGLENVYSRKIANLSKGYKQRVGLAQAIIGNPPILILDEPTSGLDPNQIVEIRDLIKSLGKEKTVILSTHILPEVESTCNRILIISNGKLVADGTKEELSRANENKWTFILSLKNESENDISEYLGKIETIKNIELLDSSENIFNFKIETEAINSVRDEIFNVCSENKFIIYEFKKIEYSLEDIFKQMTQQ